MANVTVQVQSLLNSATYNNYTLDDSNTVANLVATIQTTQGYSADWFKLYFGTTLLANANTLSSYGITSNTQIRTANRIADLPTLQDRQLAKLTLAQIRRKAGGDPTKTYYRGGNVYDITSLPTQYSGNVVVDNANATGLLVARPWLATSVVAAPETLAEALPGPVLLELESWYDADDGAYFVPSNPADGATFTQWTDKSSYAHNANPIGGATTRASYQTNELNTLSVVRFDGNDGLSINPYSGLGNAPAITMFVVAKMTSNTGNPRVFTLNVANDFNLYYDSTAGRWTTSAAQGVGQSTVANNPTSFNIHSVAFDGTKNTNADSLRYRYNKANVALTFTGTVGNTTSASTNTMYIGNNNGTNFYTGDIAEFLIFTRALTHVQIQNVENYLSTKWGL